MFTKFHFVVLDFGLCLIFCCFFYDTLRFEYMKDCPMVIHFPPVKKSGSILLNITRIKFTKKSEKRSKIW